MVKYHVAMKGLRLLNFQNVKKYLYQKERKQRCGDIGDWSKAQKFLQAGHSYLDRDNDGEACEALGRKSNKPEIGEITIKDCYDGDTCTSSDGEKIRLACIDTPELKGKRAKPNEAIAAKNFLNEMIKGEKVSIRRVTEDKYGRTVGELSFNGENLQQLLVKEGHAEIYKKYSKPCEWASFINHNIIYFLREILKLKVAKLIFANQVCSLLIAALFFS